MRASRQEQQEQTRERLLAAAERVFTDRGFSGASLDSVAAEAGLTKGAVYSNFRSKEELLITVMQRRLETGVRASRDQLEMAGGVDDLFAGLAREYEDQVRRGSGWAMLVVEFWLYAMRNEHARSLLAGIEHAVRTEMAAVLDEMSDRDGQPPPLPSYDMAAIYTALDIGIALQSLLDPVRVPASLYGEALRLLNREVPPEAGSRDGGRE